MQVGLLGPFQLLDSDGSQRAVPVRERAVVALLALDAGQVLTRDQLIDALWGTALPKHPVNALQQRVLHARRALGDEADRLATTAGGYRLDVAPGSVDALRFRRVTRDGQGALAAGDHERAASLLGEALALWRGPALQDVDAAWSHARAAALEQERLTATEHRIDADLARGHTTGLVAELRSLIAEHPLHEGLTGRLMRTLAAEGRQADALLAYDQLRRRLAEELGLDPSPTLARIHEDVLTQRVAPTPPTVGPPRGADRRTQPVTDGAGTGQDPEPAGTRRRLPAATSRFVGRDEELHRLGALIDSDRIVTVTGPGGSGKTRLALEAARTREDDGRRRVLLAELAAITDPEALPTWVAQAIGARAAPGTPAISVLTTALAGGDHLLVLDNCEHLLDAASALTATLTAACPGLTVLATSREPLGVDGEVVWPLDTLGLPDRDTRDLDRALASDAVALLVDRVRTADPTIDLGSEDVPTLVELVHELDGLPLAIELAAARARAISLTEITERLTDRFSLLAGGRRDAPVRHRALATTLDWSWELLEPAEQRAWMAAAVPAGSFSVDLLQPLLAALEPADDALEAVTALVDRSLLRHLGGGARSRYQMLATIQEYGRQRLADTDHLDVVQAAHADAVERAVTAAERCTEASWDVDLEQQREWLPDVRLALRWRLARGDRLGAQRLLAALGWLFYLSSLTGEGRRLLDRALGPLEAIDPERVEPVAVQWAAGLRIGEPTDDGLAWSRLAMDLAHGPVERTLAQGFLAAHLVLSGDFHGALGLVRREAGVGGWLEGLWRMLEGKLLTYIGELGAAEATVVRAEQLLVDGGSWSSMLAGDTLVQLALLRGDPDAVRRAAHRGIAVCQAHRAPDLETELRCMLAMGEAASGDLAEADAQIERSQELLQGSGPAMATAMVTQADAFVRFVAGDGDAARTRWHETMSLHHWTGFAYGRPFALWGLAHLDLSDGDIEGARVGFSGSLMDAIERSDMDAVACALEGLAAAALAGGGAVRAAELLGAAASRRTSMGAPRPLLSRAKADAVRHALEQVLAAEELAAATEAGAELTVEELSALASSG